MSKPAFLSNIPNNCFDQDAIKFVNELYEAGENVTPLLLVYVSVAASLKKLAS